ncbi:hypothetical protein ACJJTC_019627 [Scirpophaga incertulas]
MYKYMSSGTKLGQRAATVGVYRLVGLGSGTGWLRAAGEAVGAGVDAGPAAGTAAGSRNTASRRARTQAAAGTACRRPPRGLALVSYDRIRGRPPTDVRRPHAPPTSRADCTLDFDTPGSAGTQKFARPK